MQLILTCGDCMHSFHYCNGEVKYGSPGPTMCPDCKRTQGVIKLPICFNEFEYIAKNNN